MSGSQKPQAIIYADDSAPSGLRDWQQELILRHFAEQQGYEVQDIYDDSEPPSRAHCSDVRRGLQYALRHFSCYPETKALFVWDAGTMTLTQKAFFQVLDVLNEHGAKLVCFCNSLGYCKGIKELSYRNSIICISSNELIQLSASLAEKEPKDPADSDWPEDSQASFRYLKRASASSRKLTNFA